MPTPEQEHDEDGPDFAPVRLDLDDAIRKRLGPKLLADLEGELQSCRVYPGYVDEASREPLRDMRRGYELVAEAIEKLGQQHWTMLPDTRTIAKRTGQGRLEEVEVTLPGAMEVWSALEWLRFELGPKQAGARQDKHRVWVGLVIASIFGDHSMLVSFGQDGLFAKVLTAAWDSLRVAGSGLKARKILDRIKAARPGPQGARLQNLKQRRREQQAKAEEYFRQNLRRNRYRLRE